MIASDTCVRRAGVAGRVASASRGSEITSSMMTVVPTRASPPWKHSLRTFHKRAHPRPSRVPARGADRGLLDLENLRRECRRAARV